MKLSILMVNLNGLEYTKNAVEDVFSQDFKEFTFTLIDQASTERETSRFLDRLILRTTRFPVVKTAKLDFRVPLNNLWEYHYQNSNAPYLCYLNNDIRITRNFVQDTIEVFEKEPTVGIVVHVTNNPQYLLERPLQYEIVPFEERFVQGWDFSIRREAFTSIPSELKVFGGDDWLFVNAFRKGWKMAVVLSSHVIHYRAKSRKWYTGDRGEEASVLKALGIERLKYCNRYSNRHPK